MDRNQTTVCECIVCEMRRAADALARGRAPICVRAGRAFAGAILLDPDKALHALESLEQMDAEARRTRGVQARHFTVNVAEELQAQAERAKDAEKAEASPATNAVQGVSASPSAEIGVGSAREGQVFREALALTASLQEAGFEVRRTEEVLGPRRAAKVEGEKTKQAAASVAAAEAQTSDAAAASEKPLSPVEQALDELSALHRELNLELARAEVGLTQVLSPAKKWLIGPYRQSPRAFSLERSLVDLRAHARWNLALIRDINARLTV